MKRLICWCCLFLIFNKGTAYAQTNTGQFLFDGKTLRGWRQAQRDTLPDASWMVENGQLVFNPSKGHGSDIITTQSFKDFDLSLEFKISEGGNSGIKYFLIPNTSLGCEYQIIDDAKHPDAKLGFNGDRTTGALYDILSPNPNKPYKGAGEWNKVEIIARGNHIEHWLNGTKILEYDRDGDNFRQALAGSKFKSTEGFAQATTSPILLQAHGDKVAFRNIKIKPL